MWVSSADADVSVVGVAFLVSWLLCFRGGKGVIADDDLVPL